MTPSEIAEISRIFSPFPGHHPWDYLQHFLAGASACPSIYVLLRLIKVTRLAAIILAFIPVVFFLFWKEIEDIQRTGDTMGWIGDGVSNALGLCVALFVVILLTPKHPAIHT